ncbi:pyroglutamyl-peptidase I [Methyloceanibacter sp. wino2]|uniref:pyroglutamyl-peptidase I n=1 Tax=Methyloceanibacter sp. wino2 TaxID=2170729 RepID=UPI000D3E07DB|nr:pyroglutamyl-peptidase I [Methyloceanibacter sp. wino2]
MADVSSDPLAHDSARPRVLVTGFGPFPGVAENPSGWLAERVAATAPPTDCMLYRAVLPTEWTAVASRAAYFHQAIRPRLMIHFGVQTQASEIQLECKAHNVTEQRPDAAGAHPGRPDVISGGGDMLETWLPVDALVARLQAEKFPASVSQSCGRYICNDLYFRSLHWAEQNGSDALFVHVPQTHVLSLHTLLQAAEMILQEALQAVQLQSKFEAGPLDTLPPTDTP